MNKILLTSKNIFKLTNKFKYFNYKQFSSSSSSSYSNKFATLWKKYGYVFLGTYLSVYGTTLGSIFIALDFDLFKASDFGYDAKTLTQTVKPFFSSFLPSPSFFLS